MICTSPTTSENRDVNNKQQIVAGLEKRGDHDSIQIAEHMKSYKG